ncbi:MAG: FAD:protein FMN transferase [Planctomycetia bacterium]|jgi:thiamine biosynthesis lipoprotein
MNEDADIHTLVVGREAMACRFEVVFNVGEVPDATELGCAALDLVDEIEAVISVYRETSEISRVNAGAAAGWQPVSEAVHGLLLLARELHDRTGGGFDIAAGALVRAWGFLRRQGRTPTADDLAAACAASGMRQVEFDAAGRRVRFTRPGIEINPGAIGKGWAIDRAVDLLADAGVPSVLVHGGQSSVRARGVHGPALPGRRGWQVGLRHPLFPGRRLATITLVDQALGTSGSGTQFFVDRGRRLGHILDPRTGRPAEGVLSATVIAPTAAVADALSTAAYVLGPAGLETIAPPGGDVGAILVLPGRGPAAVRVLLANVDAGTTTIDPGPGIEVASTATRS